MAPPPDDPSSSALLLLPIRPTDHVLGPGDASYTLVEYGDYECPDCGRLFLILRGLQKDFAARLRVVFRHYPLSGIHHHAQEAAEAAEAAAAQGKFWEMHALLFERQKALQTRDLIGYAGEMNLDVERFRRELKSHVYAERVRVSDLMHQNVRQQDSLCTRFGLRKHCERHGLGSDSMPNSGTTR